MVRDHVTSSAGCVEVSSAPLHTHGFGIGDLYVIDVAAVPDGLEDGIVEAEDHDVLHRLLAQVVIDAKDLVFLQHTLDVTVQRLGGLKILAERFFDDDATPAARVLFRQARLSQLLHDWSEKPGSRGQIEKVVAFGVALQVNLGQPSAEMREGVGVGEIAALVEQTLPQPVQVIRGIGAGGKKFADLMAKRVHAQIINRNSNNGEIIGKQLGSLQVIERRKQLAFFLRPRRSKEHEDAWTGNLAGEFQGSFRVGRSGGRHRDALCLILHGNMEWEAL